MLLDGLTMSAIGLLVVFLVLVILLLTVNILNFIEKKVDAKQLNTITTSTGIAVESNNSELDLTAALIGVGLALSELEQKDQSKIYNSVRNDSSQWFSNGIQRLFRSRGN
tara:strand:- start:460 stop:789 length:330 start_codon:yes stop_codon:yes gene_type:complete